MVKILELLNSYKLKEKLKILLHAPLHPSYWIYLMETMPEYEWFIEPNENFEGAMPRDHIKYTVVSANSEIKFDAQIILLHKYGNVQELYNLVKKFPIPPVFVEMWEYSLPQFKVKYPLISGCTYCSNSEYPNIRYSYIPPSKTLWNQKWKGDNPQVFFPAQRYLMPRYSHTKLAKIYKLLLNANIKVNVIKDATREIPFTDWRNNFISSRVLLDCTDKYANFVIEEAMEIGMPIVSLGLNETSFMVRDKIDGFTKWTDSDLIGILRRFTDDKEFADEWSIKSKARGKELFSYNKTKKIFIKALEDSIILFNSVEHPFELENIKSKILTPIISEIPYDFSFIFWEMKVKTTNPDWGYPCRGYPTANILVPEFKKLKSNLQIIEFSNYAEINLSLENDTHNIFKNLESEIKSNNVLIEWDGITSKRDYLNIYNWNKNLYIIPHHEGQISGAHSSEKEEREFRKIMTEKSTKIIFELQMLRNLWSEFECNKFELFYPPTRVGIKYDKIESKKILGIKTPYTIIAWGQYTGKNYEVMLDWISDWQDTSLLFCGSGSKQGKINILNKAKELEISDKIFFSKHAISDEESDLWFSASDICACPRTYFGTATSIYVIGQGKVCVVPAKSPQTGNNSKFWDGYKELEQISGVVTSNNIRRTTRELLLNEEKRKILEYKSIKYAEENSFNNYAQKIIKLIHETNKMENHSK